MKNALLLLSFFALTTFSFTACQKDDLSNNLIEESSETGIKVQQRTANNLLSTNNLALASSTTSYLPATFPILAGQNIPAGNVHATAGLVNGVYSMILTVDMSGSNWIAGTTHIYLGDLAGVPLNSGGNPQNGQFPYGGDGSSNVYTIPLTDVPADISPATSGYCYTLLVHLEVTTEGIDSGTEIQSETGWASGDPINPDGKGNWSMYNTICL